MSTSNAFGRLLRFWRTCKQQSQEALANQLDVSTRHISRLENGKVHPSEAMILGITNAYGLNERDSSNLIMAAGYTAHIEPRDIQSPKLRWLQNAAKLSINALSPNPAALIDSYGNLVMVNPSWAALFHKAAGEDCIEHTPNLYVLLFQAMRKTPDLNRQQRTLALIMMAMYQEYLTSNDVKYLAVCEQLQDTGLLTDDWASVAAAIDPMASYRITLNLDGEYVDFYIVNQIMGTTGPAAYVSEPRLTLSVLYPIDDSFDLETLATNAVQHPLIY